MLLLTLTYLHDGYTTNGDGLALTLQYHNPNTHFVDLMNLDLKASRCHLTEERTVPLFCTCLSPYSTDCMDQDPNQPRLQLIPRNK